MEWTDERVYTFIDLYEKNATLFDLTHKDYHNKVKKTVLVLALSS